MLAASIAAERCSRLSVSAWAADCLVDGFQRCQTRRWFGLAVHLGSVLELTPDVFSAGCPAPHMPTESGYHPTQGPFSDYGEHQRSASAPNALARLISGTHNSSGLVRPNPRPTSKALWPPAALSPLQLSQILGHASKPAGESWRMLCSCVLLFLAAEEEGEEYARLIHMLRRVSLLQVSPWQPSEPTVSPAPSFEWPEVRISERLSESRSDRQLSHLRPRDSLSPEGPAHAATVSPQLSQSFQDEAQELADREASTSSKISHEYRWASPQRLQRAQRGCHASPAKPAEPSASCQGMLQAPVSGTQSGLPGPSALPPACCKGWQGLSGSQLPSCCRIMQGRSLHTDTSHAARMGS